ncbi:MAG: ATP-dependent Clp protease ATP-binding subunit ClpC, partial [Lachnospiraceae bacterium]|nr:ATP-dependent Clp protease ATP-binding subunit ClpC [Lachnospiraceae bacterium]
MGLPYTESAEAVLKTAERESKKLKHYYIGSEHILLGLLKEQDGVAGTVLRSQAIDIEAVYDLISDLTLQGKGTILKERAGMSPRTERILEDAETLAEKYHSGTVGTEHILLAIIREGNNCAVQILLALRKNPTEIYIQTLMAMGEDPQSAKEDFKK